MNFNSIKAIESLIKRGVTGRVVLLIDPTPDNQFTVTCAMSGNLLGTFPNLDIAEMLRETIEEGFSWFKLSAKDLIGETVEVEGDQFKVLALTNGGYSVRLDDGRVVGLTRVKYNGKYYFNVD